MGKTPIRLTSKKTRPHPPAKTVRGQWLSLSTKNFCAWLAAPDTHLTLNDREYLATIIDRLNRQKSTGDVHGEEKRTRQSKLPTELLVQLDELIERMKVVGLVQSKASAYDLYARRFGYENGKALKAAITRARKKLKGTNG